MGNLAPGDIVRYQKLHIHIFRPRVMHQGDLLGRHLQIRILGKIGSLEAGEDLITPTESPYQLPTNLEEADNDVVGSDITREDIAKMWSTEDLLVRGKS